MSQEEEVIVDETLEVPEKETPETNVEEEMEALRKKAEIAENYKTRAEKAEALAKALKNQPKSDVDALDFIKLGKKLETYSEEEIDFAVNHAKSKNPKDILEAFNDEMVQLAITAKREKVEKEKSLKPSGTQSETEKPKNLSDQLSSMTIKEKEEYLEKIGAYRSPRPRSDSRSFGGLK